MTLLLLISRGLSDLSEQLTEVFMHSFMISHLLESHIKAFSGSFIIATEQQFKTKAKPIKFMNNIDRLHLRAATNGNRQNNYKLQVAEANNESNVKVGV